MKKLWLTLVFVLIAVMCLTFAVSAVCYEDYDLAVEARMSEVIRPYSTGGFNNTYGSELNGNLGNGWNNGVCLANGTPRERAYIEYKYASSHLIRNITINFDHASLEHGYSVYLSNDGGNTWELIQTYYLTDEAKLNTVVANSISINGDKGMYANAFRFEWTGKYECLYVSLSEIDITGSNVLDCKWVENEVLVTGNCGIDREANCTCSVCGEQKLIVTEATGEHTWDEGVQTKEPTEDEEGLLVYTCSVCNGTKEVVLPTLSHVHSYDDNVGFSKEPTCVNKGSATYKCSCGDTIEQEVAATGNHNYTVFVEYVEGKAPTYLYDGVGVFKCETCDATDEIEVSRLVMNTVKYSDVSVPEGTCWVVGPKYLVDGNYKFGSGGSHNSQTYTINFVYGEDYYFDKIFIVTNSTGTQGTSDPSQNPFNSEYMTTRAYNFTVKLLDKDGETVFEKKYHTSDGKRYVGVDENGSEFDYQALNVQFEEAIVAYSMTIDVECKGDNSVGLWEVETYGLPVNYHEDHTYTVLQQTITAPTCTSEGLGVYRCNRCEETAEAAIPVIAHTYNVEVEGTRVDATCADAGSVTMKCANCDATEVQTLNATGHTYDNENDGVCNVCEASRGVARVGVQYFATLEEAIAAGDEIVVIGKVTVEGDATWNFAGKTITLAYADENNYAVVVKGNLTIVDGTFNVQALFGFGVTGTLTVNGGTFNADATYVDYMIGSWGTTVINNGTFNGKYCNVNAFAGTATINGGSFVVAGDDSGYDPIDVEGYTTINAGTFSTDVSAFVAEGKCQYANGVIAADISDTYYAVDGMEIKIENGIAYVMGDEYALSYDAVNNSYTSNYPRVSFGFDRGGNLVFGMGEQLHKHTADMYIATVTAPTCTKDGYTTYKCKGCGHTYTDNVVPAAGHGEAVIKEEIKPTCKDPGSITKVCAKCGEVVSTETIAPIAHTVAHVEAKAATCFENGNIEYWYCSVCGFAWLDADCTLNTNLKAVVLPAAHGTITHVEAKAATCTEFGNIEYWSCADCGYAWLDEACTLNTNLKAVVLPKAEHEWDEGYFMGWPYPTCQNPIGTKTYTCKVCYETYDEENVAVDLNDVQWHNADLEVETATDATCTAAGYKKYTCLDCGEVFEIITPADTENGHKWIVDKSVSYDATCAKDGYSKQTCEICNTTRELVLDKEFYGQHVYGYNPETYVEATCKQDGYAFYTCEVCGDSYEKTTSASPDLHEMVNSSNGLIQTCAVCGEVQFGNAELTGVENGFKAMFVWSGTGLNIWNADADIYYNITVVSSENGVYVLTLSADDDAFGFNGKTATLTTVADGGTLVITVDDDTSYTLENKAPDYNGIINGTFESVDGSVKIEFKDGVATVLKNEAGLNLGESFTYNYNPMIGVVNAGVPYMITYSLDEDAIYIGKNPLYRAAEGGDEEPENYGNKIGEFEVETTDTYGYNDLYSYTAKAEGKYSFFVPAGLGFYSAAVKEVFGAAEVGFYTNEAGEYATFYLAAGETLEFYIGSTEKAVWTIDVYFYHDEHTEVEIPAVPGELRNPGMTSGVKCSVCGEILVAPVQADGDFRFATRSLTLGENINIVYKIQVPNGFENVYLVCEMKVLENGQETIKSFVIDEYDIDPKTGNYVFKFAGIRLQSMADMINATVYGEKDGVITANSYSNQSVKSYIIGQLEKKENTAELKTMLSDLLILGAKTQIYMNYRANDLMTSDVKEGLLTPSKFEVIPGSAFVQKMIINDEGTRAIADWTSVSLTFKDAMSIKFKLTIDESKLDDIVIKVTIPGINGPDRIDTYTKEDLTLEDGKYVLEVDNIKASLYGQTVVGDIYYNGEKISRTVNYSVDSYLQKNQNSTNVALRDFLRAAYLYGKSVLAYNNK